MSTIGCSDLSQNDPQQPRRQKRPRFGGVSLCLSSFLDNFHEIHEQLVVASEGFEPPKSKTADLQSDPFGHLGNSPERTRPT